MTLGQHIQTLRKDRGLSQEALGEALGVSRQAVSQWEADASLPELDKLVALSRLFGVSLGWLLQIEERGESPPPEERAGYEALRAERARLARSRRLGHALSALSAALAVAVLIFLWVRLDRAEASLSTLEIVSDIPALDPAAPLVAALDFSAARDGSTLDLDITLAAAQQVEGMTVTFQGVEDLEGSIQTAAATPYGTNYQGHLSMPDCYGGVTLTAVFDVGGRRYTQALARNIIVRDRATTWEPLWPSAS